MTPGTPAAGSDMVTMIYRPINKAFPNHVSPPLREQAMNVLSIKPSFRKIFLFVIEKRLSIEGRGKRISGSESEGYVKKLDKTETPNPHRHNHHTF